MEMEKRRGFDHKGVKNAGEVLLPCGKSRNFAAQTRWQKSERRRFVFMKIKEVVEALEKFAPLPLQESYDNAGLQIGITGSECSGALLCLDVTEAVIEEAVAAGLNLIIAHHPLLFRGLKCVADTTQVERCVRLAIQHDIVLYAAHTNLDNAQDGVSHEMATRLGLQAVEFLDPSPDGRSGSGVVGVLPQPMEALSFLQQIKSVFGVESLQYTVAQQKQVQRIALCGGSGDFLIDCAIACEADLFLTGEIGYHRFFGHENELWLAALGHYQSERYTIDLMERIVQSAFPQLPTQKTRCNTNPIQYL